MSPFYFGIGSQRLFGVFHAPEQGRNQTGVVVCQPLFREYILAHRVLRVLADNLASLGLPVLRFDYIGCGDSAGECEQVRLGQCAEDIRAAAAELQDMSGVRKISLVGLRLGGTMAAQIASAIPAVDRVVLWDPVLRGSEYLAELFDSHRQRTGKAPAPDLRDGVEGFALSAALHAELRELDLATLERFPGNRVFVVHREPGPSWSAWKKNMDAKRVQVHAAQIPSPPIWQARADEARELVPTATLKQIAAWVEQP